MNTEIWVVVGVVVISLGLLWISEYGKAQYERGYGASGMAHLAAVNSLRLQLDHKDRMAGLAWENAYRWYHEVIKLNKAQRRLRRRLLRWREQHEHGKARIKIQAQASLEAPKQGTAGEEGTESRVPLRRHADPQGSADEGREGEEGTGETG